MLRRSLTLVLASLVFTSTAEAGALNPWGVPGGKGVFGILPYVYVFPNETNESGVNIYPILYLTYGFTDAFELDVGQSFYFGGDWGSGADTLEIMPRYFFTDTMGVALHALIGTYADGPIDIGPEFQAAWSWDPLDLGLNAGYYLDIYDGNVNAGTIKALIAPEHYFTDSFSVYLEGDIIEYLDPSGTDFQVVPGISWSFAEKHYFSLGVQIPVTDTYDGVGNISYGLWYYTSFGGGGGDDAATRAEHRSSAARLAEK
jgi:hypothetical protein